MFDILEHKLNPSQLDAVKATEGPVLVLAGAGSGKTRVLTLRAAHLVENCFVRPWNVLAITFTNKAANEMKHRMSALTDCADSMWISTIHSMCAKILRFDSAEIGFTSNFSIYSEQDSERAYKAVLRQLDEGDEYVTKNAIYHISEAKNLAMTPEEYNTYKHYDRSIDQICAVYKAYQASLKKSNAMDFDDLLFNTLKLLKSSPAVLEKYQQKFKYIMVDEFQDTNRVQYQVLKLLQAFHKNFFVVGDDDQSIYGWRGAEIQNILNFDKDFPSAKTFKLEQNYRSTKKILSVANTIIQKNEQRHNKELWTENCEGVKIETYCGYNDMEEAFYVRQQIEGLVRHNNMKLSDFAVLMRVNSLTRSFEQEFTKYSIPSRVFGGFKFFERKEVKDLLSYIKLIANSKDNEALARVINIPKRGIGETTVEKLRSLSREFDLSIFEVLAQESLLKSFNSSARNKLTSFAHLIQELINCEKESGLEQLLKKTIQLTDFRQSFQNCDDSFERLLNIDELEQAVHEFCQNNLEANANTFLESVTLQADVDGKEKGDCVSLATIHAAKGLEFKVVFVVGLEDGLFPISRAQNSKKDMEEERRLMYVAVTRACQRLYVTRARNRFTFGETRTTLPSVFFTEIDNFLNPKMMIDGIALRQPYVADTGSNSNALKLPSSSFKTGQKVNHKVFGSGIILCVKGENADIVFKAVGIKTLALKFAPLEILD